VVQYALYAKTSILNLRPGRFALGAEELQTYRTPRCLIDTWGMLRGVPVASRR
jgi:hypothetical protein